MLLSWETLSSSVVSLDQLPFFFAGWKLLISLVCVAHLGFGVLGGGNRICDGEVTRRSRFLKPSSAVLWQSSLDYVLCTHNCPSLAWAGAGEEGSDRARERASVARREGKAQALSSQLSLWKWRGRRGVSSTGLHNMLCLLLCSQRSHQPWEATRFHIQKCGSDAAPFLLPCVCLLLLKPRVSRSERMGRVSSSWHPQCQCWLQQQSPGAPKGSAGKEPRQLKESRAWFIFS